MQDPLTNHDLTCQDMGTCSTCGQACLSTDNYTDWLFDLEADPREEHNLIHEFPQVIYCLCVEWKFFIFLLLWAELRLCAGNTSSCWRYILIFFSIPCHSCLSLSYHAVKSLLTRCGTEPVKSLSMNGRTLPIRTSIQMRTKVRNRKKKTVVGRKVKSKMNFLSSISGTKKTPFFRSYSVPDLTRTVGHGS